MECPEEEPITASQATQLLKRFNLEGRNKRSILKARTQSAWTARTNPQSAEATNLQGLNPDVNRALDSFLSQRLLSGRILDVNVVFDEFLASQLHQFDSILNENKHLFLDAIHSRLGGETISPEIVPDVLRQRRTAALWSGLRRVYFAEQESESALEDEFLAIAPDSRRRVPRVNNDLHVPVPSRFGPPDDSDDAPSGSHVFIGPPAPIPEDDLEQHSHDGFSNGEDEIGANFGLASGENARSPTMEMVTTVYKRATSLGKKVVQVDVAEAFMSTNGKNPQMDEDDVTKGKDHPVKDKASDFIGGGKITTGNFIGGGPIISRVETVVTGLSRRMFLSVKTMRRILAAKETIHKYGVFVPRNNREADSSPESVRWASGRQLEWLRLQEQGTFERNWNWTRLRKVFPQYRKQDVGHIFFVYDHKHSGEHRVRLVFDGSRQNPETYTDTYAPTARGESVRLFHVFAVEEG